MFHFFLSLSSDAIVRKMGDYILKGCPPDHVLTNSKIDAGNSFLEKRVLWIGRYNAVTLHKVELAPVSMDKDGDPLVFVALKYSHVDAHDDYFDYEKSVAYVMRASGRGVVHLENEESLRVSRNQSPWSPQGTYLWAAEDSCFCLYSPVTGKLLNKKDIGKVESYDMRLKFSANERHLAIVFAVNHGKSEECYIYTVPDLTLVTSICSESTETGYAFKLFEIDGCICVTGFGLGHTDHKYNTQRWFDLENCCFENFINHQRAEEDAEFFPREDFSKANYTCRYSPDEEKLKLARTYCPDNAEIVSQLLPDLDTEDALRRKYFVVHIYEYNVEFGEELHTCSYAGIVMTRPYSDRTLRLFRPCVRGVIFHLMCVKQRLDNDDSKTGDEISLDGGLKLSPLPRLPMSMWLHLFHCVESVL